MVGVVGSLELVKDEEDCEVCGQNVDDLHRRVIDGDKRRKQVKVTCCEDQSEQHLTFSRYTFSTEEKDREAQRRSSQTSGRGQHTFCPQPKLTSHRARIPHLHQQQENS